MQNKPMGKKTFHGPVNPTDFADALVAEFNQGNLEAKRIGQGNQRIVQIATPRWNTSGGRTAITIHLIIRYRELAFNNPEAEQRKLVLDTVRLMVTPCLYAALTTIAGFGSLLLCDLLPVKTFGWMMIAGIIVSLAVTFLLFPAGLMVVPKKPHRPGRIKRKSTHSLTSLLAGFTGTHGRTILVTSGIIFIISLIDFFIRS